MGILGIFLGGSGAGKSTLLRVLNNLEKGSIRLEVFSLDKEIIFVCRLPVTAVFGIAVTAFQSI